MKLRNLGLFAAVLIVSLFGLARRPIERDKFLPGKNIEFTLDHGKFPVVG